MANNREEMSNASSSPKTGLLASLQRLLGTFAEILHTRAEILATELEEASWRVGQLILYGVVAFLFLMLALLMLTVFVIKASPEVHQLTILVGFGLFYLLIGGIAFLVLRYKLKNWPPLFSTTLSELNKDRRHLSDQVNSDTDR